MKEITRPKYHVGQSIVFQLAGASSALLEEIESGFFVPGVGWFYRAGKEGEYEVEEKEIIFVLPSLL